LRDALGDDAPDVLHFWVDGGLDEGIILRARVAKGAQERIAHWLMAALPLGNGVPAAAG
jgi:hypothetical protein